MLKATFYSIYIINVFLNALEGMLLCNGKHQKERVAIANVLHMKKNLDRTKSLSAEYSS